MKKLAIFSVCIIAIMLVINNNVNEPNCSSTSCVYEFTPDEKKAIESMMYAYDDGYYQGEYNHKYFNNSYCNMVYFEGSRAIVFQTPVCFEDPSKMSVEDPGLQSCWFFQKYENSCISGKGGYEYNRLKDNSEFDEIIQILE